MILRQQRTTLTYVAVNDCSYPVTYTWCMTGTTSGSAFECRAPTFARGGGAVGPRAQSVTSYRGGVGQLHVFTCKAPAAPVISEAGRGKFTYECRA